MAEHLGQRLKFVRKQLGLTIERFAAPLNLSKSAISQMENGKQGIKGSTLAAICSVYSVNPRYLEKGEQPVFVKLPRLARATEEQPFVVIPAITGYFPDKCEESLLSTVEEDYLMFRRSWIEKIGSPESFVTMRAHDNSLYPMIHRGDILLIDRTSTTLREGRIFLIRMPREAVVRKIVMELDGRVYLVTSGKDSRGPYDPERVPVLGEVVWMGRSLTIGLPEGRTAAE